MISRLVRSPRFWNVCALITFTALIVLPRALRSQWPEWLTFLLAAATCPLLAASWVAAGQVSPRTAALICVSALLLVGLAAYGWR